MASVPIQSVMAFLFVFFCFFFFVAPGDLLISQVADVVSLCFLADSMALFFDIDTLVQCLQLF